ncbi:tail length tape-measure protein [Lactococcus phage P596]|uniref:Tail length tape-measure protein n=1 Tax=Lactococcus phage P596 TaxID=2656515 RepID=A0A5Q2F3S2_9CAUD|nr:tail length tape-measure protein [Lactococcus phage P596]QGF21103.1 tail length tape-measure protein [Lactococcus phage P596]
MKNRKNIIKENNAQMEALESYINDKLAELNDLRASNRQLDDERLVYLRAWYNSRLDNDYNLQKVLDYISESYLPSHNYTVDSIKKLLHSQTLNNERYRTERKLYNRICNYINDNSSEYVYPNDVAVLVKKYKTQNAKRLIKKLELEYKLKIRKQNLTDLLVGNRGNRLWERKNMTDYERAYCWYKDKLAKFVSTTIQKFKTLLNDNGIHSYDIMFNYCGPDLINWHDAITKSHTMTLGQLKAITYKQIKEQYVQAINGYNNTIAKDVKEKALQKHKLATMAAKERKKVQFEKWLKVKNTLSMFSGAIEINKKIDFDNYKPVPAKPAVERVKNVINDCGLVETHETRSDGTTTISLYV